MSDRNLRIRKTKILKRTFCPKCQYDTGGWSRCPMCGGIAVREERICPEKIEEATR